MLDKSHGKQDDHGITVGTRGTWRRSEQIGNHRLIERNNSMVSEVLLLALEPNSELTMSGLVRHVRGSRAVKGLGRCLLQGAEQSNFLAQDGEELQNPTTTSVATELWITAGLVNEQLISSPSEAPSHPCANNSLRQHGEAERGGLSAGIKSTGANAILAASIGYAIRIRNQHFLKSGPYFSSCRGFWNHGLEPILGIL